MGFPLVYELNTRCWLHDLSEQTGQRVTLADIPPREFARWRALGFTHLWLMGVWTGGPQARAKALAPELHKAYSEALPDWTEDDVVASPYAVADYKVDAALGGTEALAVFRRELRRHGLKLLLDFVPNHLGLDHPWLRERPDLFVQFENEAAGTFVQETVSGARWLAWGKDPNFAPWTDTVQLDYRREATRAAMLEMLQAIAVQCDGVRCDMAMLLLNDVFKKTWQGFPISESCPTTEFWFEAVRAVKSVRPDFLFLAEAYWGLESRLQSLGFDYTYDKAFYDRLVSHDGPGAQRHVLGQPLELLSRGARFLENHDEPRVARLLPLDEHRAALLAMLSAPGLRLLHEGQLSGAQRKLPVQLRRRVREPVNPEIAALYEKQLAVMRGTVPGQGTAEVLVPREAWAGNPTAVNFILVQWQNGPDAFELAVSNLAPHPSQCYAPLRVSETEAEDWLVVELLGGEQYLRAGAELRKRGLYLDVPAHGAQFFQFRKRSVSGGASTQTNK